jgi:hypothetical protein
MRYQDRLGTNARKFSWRKNGAPRGAHLCVSFHRHCTDRVGASRTDGVCRAHLFDDRRPVLLVFAKPRHNRAALRKQACSRIVGEHPPAYGKRIISLLLSDFPMFVPSLSGKRFRCFSVSNGIAKRGGFLTWLCELRGVGQRPSRARDLVVPTPRLVSHSHSIARPRQVVVE